MGKGYNDAFIANLSAIVRRLRAGEDIEIVSGPDDICAPLVNSGTSEQPHCLNKSVSERDDLAASKVSELLSYQISRGRRISCNSQFLQQMHHAFVSGTIRQACFGCQWNELCSSVALNREGKIHSR